MKNAKRERGANPGLIAEFQLIVRRHAKAEEPTIELPTDFLVTIADALDWVRRPGRPPNTRRQVLDVSRGLMKGRLRLEELKEEGVDARQALERAAIDLHKDKPFKDLSLKTIEDGLQRRKRTRRQPKNLAGK